MAKGNKNKKKNKGVDETDPEALKVNYRSNARLVIKNTPTTW